MKIMLITNKAQLTASSMQLLVDLAGKEGVNNLSLVKITRQLELSRGSLLLKYGNKDEIMTLLFQQLLAEELAFIQLVAKSENQPKEQLHAFVQAAFEYGYVNQRNKRVKSEV